MFLIEMPIISYAFNFTTVQGQLILLYSIKIADILFIIQNQIQIQVMVHSSDRQRQRQREKGRGRYGRNRSPSNQQQRYYRRSRSKSGSKQRRRSRQHRQIKERSQTSHHRSSSDQYDKYQRSSHSKKRSQSSQSNSNYQGKQEEEIQQKIRIGLRNGDLHFNKEAHQIYMSMPQRKQQQLNEQARSPQKIHQCILVRQLFISGINDINQYTITELMGKYGQIQNIEIIKDFAFVKYYRVEDASNACADYHNINASVQPLINSNFKIFFADHLKRWNVVANNPEYQIRQYLVPVVYASLKNDPHYANQKYLLSIFKKYGFVRNLQLRKNQFPGPKIHVNVQYETLDMALRARDKLKNNRQKFGDKKTQIVILIDSQKITRVFPNISNQIRYQKKRLQNLGGNMNPMMGNMNSYNSLNNSDSYKNSNMMGSMNIMSNPMSNSMNKPMSNPMANPMSNPMANPMSNPMANPTLSSNAYQTQDIFAMLQKLNQNKIQNILQDQIEQDSDWVGFFTRNNQYKVEVDFNRIHKEVPFQLESILNVSHRGDISQALNRTDYILAGKFKAANRLNQQNFDEYIKYFIKKNRGGIIFTNSYLIYLLPPKQDLNLPYTVASNQLLALFFKIKN